METSVHVQGGETFKIHWTIWKILGAVVPNGRTRYLYYIYSFVLNMSISVGYPLHLMIGLLTSESQYDVFKNLGINLTSLVCGIMMFVIGRKLDKVNEMMNIVKKLDKRVILAEDVEFYKSTVLPNVKSILYLFYFLCIGAEIAVIIMGIFGEWRLMFPAYFPFDAYDSSFKFAVAHLYQLIGVTVHIVQNLSNDTIGGMTLAMIAGQASLLGRRVACIGYDKTQTMEQNNEKLLECIEDYKQLLSLRDMVENLISLCMFVQIIFAGVNMCVTIFFMIFYVDDIFSYVFYTIYLFAMPMQIYSACYYGTYMEIEFDKLTYSIFSCNWPDLDKKFKQNLRIYTEQTLRQRNVFAAGMFCINLNTFFASCKGAYSLFTLCMQMK